jgi:DNA-binding response OmpR family regulator
MDTAPPVAAYRFEGFVLDVRRGSLLTAAGQPLALRRQSFEMLCLFVENAGRLLDRDTTPGRSGPTSSSPTTA